MQPLRNHIATVLLLIAACSGCTDKDRALAKRTGDGSDTFKYKAPKTIAPTETPPSLVKPAPTKLKGKGDGSDTFHYKRDPRTFPNQPKARED